MPGLFHMALPAVVSEGSKSGRNSSESLQLVEGLGNIIIEG